MLAACRRVPALQRLVRGPVRRGLAGPAVSHPALPFLAALSHPRSAGSPAQRSGCVADRDVPGRSHASPPRSQPGNGGVPPPPDRRLRQLRARLRRAWWWRRRPAVPRSHSLFAAAIGFTAVRRTFDAPTPRRSPSPSEAWALIASQSPRLLRRAFDWTPAHALLSHPAVAGASPGLPARRPRACDALLSRRGDSSDPRDVRGRPRLQQRRHARRRSSTASPAALGDSRLRARARQRRQRRRRAGSGSRSSRATTRASAAST